MTYHPPFQDIEEGKNITSFNKLKGTWVYDLLKEGEWFGRTETEYKWYIDI